jgi:hypothetical protein
VPNHSPLKKGALHRIASDVARARSISVDTILCLSDRLVTAPR